MLAAAMSGRLYLVPNLLGLAPPENVLPAKTIAIARGLDHFVVENAEAGARVPEVARDRAAAPRNRDRRARRRSDARSGAPNCSRPRVRVRTSGSCPMRAAPASPIPARRLSRRRTQAAITVVPLVGPSAVLLALMASGMNGQAFAFHGYLPVPAPARAEAIRALEAESRATGRTQLFIETPYRNAALLAALVETCRPQTRLCVAADLTLETESVEARAIRAWKGRDFGRYAKRPTMFVLAA